MDQSGLILHNIAGTMKLRPVHLLGVATALLGFVISAAADNMVTIAGSGSDGFSGDGGNALAAQMGAIWGLAVDAQGNVYFADTWNQRVRKVTAGGAISTIAGSGSLGDGGDGGPALSADLFWPAGLALDTAGNLYVSTGARVRKISSDGTIAAFAGTSSAGYGGDGQNATAAALREPRGLAVDSAGNVYIADSGNFRIRKVGQNGKIATIAGNGQRTRHRRPHRLRRGPRPRPVRQPLLLRPLQPLRAPDLPFRHDPDGCRRNVRHRRRWRPAHWRSTEIPARPGG